MASFTLGMIRFWSAEATSFRLSGALLTFRALPRAELPEGPLHPILSILDGTTPARFEAYSYVRDISHLVYTTTLLDTFLNDTTLFLLLCHPRSIGPAKHIPLDTVLNASSIPQVLTEAAIRRSREVSFLSFDARIDFLSQTFGLDLSIPDQTRQALAHYPSVRNAAVHDQGVFEITLADNGELVSRQKACPIHPIPLSPDDVTKAAACYETVAWAVATSVFNQVLNITDHPALAALSLHHQSRTDQEGG